MSRQTRTRLSVFAILGVGIVIGFILYTFLGPYLPSAMSHRGASPDMFIHYAIFTTEGVFGVPLGALALHLALAPLASSPPPYWRGN